MAIMRDYPKGNTVWLLLSAPLRVWASPTTKNKLFSTWDKPTDFHKIHHVISTNLCVNAFPVSRNCHLAAILWELKAWNACTPLHLATLHREEKEKMGQFEKIYIVATMQTKDFSLKHCQSTKFNKNLHQTTRTKKTPPKINLIE